MSALSSAPSRALLRLAVASLPVLLTGCATMTPTAGTSVSPLVCEAWRPVTWSSRDTDQTIREARANNAAWEAYCD